MSLQTARIIYYIIGNTLEFHLCRLLKFKNVNKWNPPELTILYQNLAWKWTYMYSFTVEYKIAVAPFYVHVVYQTRETVFHQDIQTSRGELKIRHAAEYFWRNSSCLDSRSMKHCLECLIYLLNQNKNLRVNGEIKSSKSMLIKTGYPNPLHASDFLCFNIMNY